MTYLQEPICRNLIGKFKHMKPYRDFFKRAIDIVVSGAALLVLALPMAVVTVWLHFVNKGAGAFFFQERPGKNGKIFRICKFKSMTDQRDANGNLLSDAQRLTKAGKFVRTTSIDELPQLWNVLRGDMSLIGPRPLLVRYLPWYTERERIRHLVRPGITGLAQVNGRSFTTWDVRLEEDVKYVENLNFLNDVKIILKTIHQVINKQDIEVAPHGDYLDVERRNRLKNEA